MLRSSDDVDLRYRLVKTAWGWCWFAVSPRGLWRCELPRRTRDAVMRAIRAELPSAREDPRLWPEFVRSLQSYFEGRSVEWDVELDDTGMTPFRLEVYRLLSKTPSGATLTYKQLAEAAGSVGAARGVGSAMRRNPFPPVVPCHRVVGSDGRLCGFSAEGGLDLKRRLLELEEQHMPQRRTSKRGASVATAPRAKRSSEAS